MGEYTTTLSNDTANEETITLATMVKPLILNGDHTGNGLFEGGTSATSSADM